MIRLAALLMALLWCIPALAQERTPLLMEGKKSLYQRVLSRPGATLTAAPTGAAGAAVPAFTPFYVYARKDGWLELGKASRGKPDGWLKDDQTIAWKQTLTASFPNPSGRERVVFAKDRPALEAAIRSGDTVALKRDAIAMEPETHIDIRKQFYLLPILSAVQAQTPKGYPLREVEIASIPLEEQKAPPAASPDAERTALLKKFNAGLVFVVDTTLSMDPYIDRTRTALKQVLDRIRATELKDQFRFGMVGFRGNTQGRAGLDYVSRSFAKLDIKEAADAFTPKVAGVKAATVSTAKFDEDSMAGVKTALDENDWSLFAGKYLILITDAGAIESNDPLSTTRLGPAQLRALAKEKGVAIYVIHLLTPEGDSDHAKAKRQYTELSEFPGAGALYYPVPGGAVEAFGATVDALTEALIAQAYRTAGVAPPAAAAAPKTAEATRLQEQTQIVGNAMRLAYLGKQEGAKAPSVFRAWAADRDLAKPEVQSLEVRVLLSRSQLSDLRDALKLILEQGLATQISAQDFFTQLRAAAAAMSRDPRNLGRVTALGNLVGEYLDDLPYKSQIMELSEDDWLAMGAAGQRELLDSIEAKLRLYQAYYDQPQLWVSFDGGKVPGDAVFAVPLDVLP